MTTTNQHHLKYTPDEHIRIHDVGAIRLLCAAFQSHDKGIPEWIKNGADEYAREDVPEQYRPIVVLFDKGSQSRSSSISVLDFNGMDASAIEDHFRVWADPEASTRGTSGLNIQGGHGNGGKCYMTMMFDDYAIIDSAKRGKGVRYGVPGESSHFGYVPDEASGRSFVVDDVRSHLADALAGIGVHIDDLPDQALEALRARQGFTLVTGRNPKGFGSKIPVSDLIDALADHPQMIRTLEFCNVYVMSNGKVVDSANPLALEVVTPDPAFPDARTIAIPTELKDPQTRFSVSTTSDGKSAPGKLVLRTSDKSMRYGNRKNRHNMVYHAVSGYVGYRPMRELDVRSAYVNNIYGECTLESLESAKQNDRGPLANSPLARAVEAWISSQVQDLAAEFEARDRRSYDQKEKQELSRLNEALDKWKNRFMSEFMSSLGGGGDEGDTVEKPTWPTGVPARIEVSLSFDKAGIGVSFRPNIRFFDKDERRIRPVPFQWVSSNTNVAWVDPDINIINTFSPGETTIWAETLDTGLTSNQRALKVLRIREISLDPSSIELSTGSRRRLEALCSLSNGDVEKEVALVWTEGNPVVARVSASGMVFGGSPGVTTVTAGDDQVMAVDGVEVTVVAGDGGDESGKGRSYPKILVSGFDPDPETDEDVTLSSDEPPVLQRVQDVEHNIWWINSSSPMARMYLNHERGYGYDSREWRIYHVERYIEIITQIALTGDPNLDLMSIDEWLIAWGERTAAIQAGAAASLDGFIEAGDISEL